MDDSFMTVFFKDNIKDTQLMLQIILEKPDLEVQKVEVQKSLKSLTNRSIIIDVHAVDGAGNEYGIEIQRADAGAGYRRARYNSALLDSSIIEKGSSTEELPETYIIFITENDVIGMNKPIYHIDRYIAEDKNNSVCDGSHIIYVNGAIKGNQSDLAKLMYDFSCSQADDMYYSQLADRMRSIKEDEREAKKMSSVMEAIRQEGIEEGLEKGIEKGIEKGLEEGRREVLVNNILDFLSDLGEVDEKLKERIRSEKNIDKLSVYLKSAARASTIEEFINKM